MSIIPASRLSRSDLNRLGNNVDHPKRTLKRSADSLHRRAVAAMNRSLASVGERIDRITHTESFDGLVPAGGGCGF